MILLLLPTLGLGGQAQPQDLRAVFEQAQRELMAGNYAKAEAGFREVLKMDPRSAAAHSNLGVVYMRMERLGEAIESFLAAKKLAPQVVGIDLNLGLAYYRKLEFSKAIPQFQQVLKSVPSSFQARYLLGMSYFMENDYQHAIDALEPLASEQKDDLD